MFIAVAPEQTLEFFAPVVTARSISTNINIVVVAANKILFMIRFVCV